MLLSTSLLPLPPPPTSLLPPLSSDANTTQPSHASHHRQHHQQHHRRPRVPPNPRATLPALTTDERQLHQRKIAIAMYGYSWLKPAGCAKTMLGMREEQLERDEVDRQMREAEIQERMQTDAEEMERRLERETEGDMAGVEERDLDDEVPEAEEVDGWGSDNDEQEGLDDEDGMQGDLDDDIPDAEDDASEMLSDEEMTSEVATRDSPARNDWTYDTRREPDTDENESGDEALQRIRRTARLAREQRQAGYQRTPGAPGSDYDVDERDAEALALAEEMLDEEDLGDAVYGNEPDRDLDDSVPEAEEGDWEHTDSGDDDIDEEEMDISIMPAQHRTRRSDGSQQLPSSIGRSPRSTRVVSGNAALGARRYEDTGVSSTAASSSRARHGLRSQAQLRNSGPSQESYDTPTGAVGIGRGRGIPRTSMLLATESSFGAANTDLQTGGMDDSLRPGGGDARRGWLNPASARRNLFGLSRGPAGGNPSAGGNADGQTGANGGGLFTPETQTMWYETPDQAPGGSEMSSARQTRSGRLLSGLGRRGRRAAEDGT